MDKNAYFSTQTEDAVFCGRDRLSADEEINLSKQILAGEDAKRTLSHNRNIPEEERSALQALIDEGESAYETLVLANQPRAAKIAAETVRKNPFGLNDFEDYMQTAMKVICKCARTFDWKAGCRFGTYVHRSLQNEMMRENAKTEFNMRIPEENLARLSSLKRLCENKSIEEAAQELSMTTEEAVKLLLAGSPAKSLYQPVNEDSSDMDLGETLCDETVLTTEEIDNLIDLQNQIKILYMALSELSDIERDLLLGRMGFNSDPLPMKAFVGKTAKSISGVQKKQIAAVKHLREIYFSLPMAG